MHSAGSDKAGSEPTNEADRRMPRHPRDMLQDDAKHKEILVTGRKLIAYDLREKPRPRSRADLPPLRPRIPSVCVQRRVCTAHFAKHRKSTRQPARFYGTPQKRPSRRTQACFETPAVYSFRDRKKRQYAHVPLRSGSSRLNAAVRPFGRLQPIYRLALKSAPEGDRKVPLGISLSLAGAVQRLKRRPSRARSIRIAPAFSAMTRVNVRATRPGRARERIYIGAGTGTYFRSQDTKSRVDRPPSALPGVCPGNRPRMSTRPTSPNCTSRMTPRKRKPEVSSRRPRRSSRRCQDAMPSSIWVDLAATILGAGRSRAERES